jgi:hypothetical protein
MLDLGFDLLLEENGSESGIESTNAFVLGNLTKATQKTAGKSWLRYKSNAGSLKGAERNVSKELSHGGRCEVDGSTVLGCRFVTEEVYELLFEQFVTSKLEGALKEVTGGGRAETSEKCTSTLIGDYLPETTNHAIIVRGRVELNASLDAVSEVSLMDLGMQQEQENAQAITKPEY